MTTFLPCFSPRRSAIDTVVLSVLRDARGFFRRGMTARDLRQRIARLFEVEVPAAKVRGSLIRLRNQGCVEMAQGWRVS